MTENISWREKRIRIESDLADCFASRASIGKKDFIRIFFYRISSPSIGDFNSQYLAGDKQLDEIFVDLAERTGLDKKRVNSHYDRNETFTQFGEHLLRSGAYKKTKK
ncbi:hypothetical protein J7M07_03205 [bacterium]|nr:hypothetical protein [bacterium]